MYESTNIITVTLQDDQRLRHVAVLYAENESSAAMGLLAELERAVVVEPALIPPSVVTMSSRVVCRTDSGDERTVTLVYPRQADVSRGRISVLAPLGRALLGAAVGDRVEVLVGNGRTSAWIIERIEYQPEAAGDYHL